MKNKNKKLLNKKTALIAGISFFGLILPKIVFAYWWVPYGMKKVLGIFKSIGEATVNEFGEALLSVLINFIFRLLNWLVRAAASTFEAMLNVGFESHIDIVKRGWEITRDFSNMLFILFLVIIAFATILRLPRYGIKELLPKVIIIALLINFSLVICSVIIDFSNITANFFVNDIQKKINNKGGISGTLADSVKLSKTHFAFDCDDEGLSPEQEKECKELEKKQEGYDIFTMLIVLTIGSLVMLVFAFVLFAGAILLLIRIVIIWFLLMLVPLVFICYIMPGLRQNWQRWWKTFLQWCFFAPAYAFFIWLATMVAMEGKTENLASKYEPQLSGTSPLETVFTSTPATALVNYFFIIALLIGGLIAAQKFGIYGASTAMNIGQKWGKGAGRWIGRQGMKPIKATGRAAGAGALVAGGKLFGGKLGRRMEAKGFQVRQKAAQEKQHKAFQELLKTTSDEGVKKEMHSKGIRGFLATQEAKKRGLLREAKRDDVRRAAETMRASGAAEEARSLEELRPDAIKDKDKRKEAIERAIKEGTHKKWSKEVFESPEGEEIVGELQRQLGSSELTKVFKGWAKDIQIEAEKALEEGFSDNFDESTNAGKDNMGRRRAHANITGELDKSFYGYKQNKQLENKFRDHIGGWGNEDFKILNKPKAKESRKLVVQFMKTAQVDGAAAHLSGDVKEEMMKFAEQYNKPVFEQMQISLGWGGKSPSTPGPTGPPSPTPPRTVDLKTSEEEFREAREEARKKSKKEKPFG